MSYQLVYHEERPATPQPGDCWPAPYIVAPGEDRNWYVEYWLSPEYVRDWLDKRPPIIVRLPDGAEWCIDQRATDNDHGWTVTGEPPHLTANPSIASIGYHGWLRDGVLTDDVEGRSFQEQPQ